jgi:hypothetical protein
VPGTKINGLFGFNRLSFVSLFDICVENTDSVQQARLVLRYFYGEVSFTDGTDQTYLAIVHLQGDPCEEHGWDYHASTNKKCVDLDA